MESNLVSSLTGQVLHSSTESNPILKMEVDS